MEWAEEVVESPASFETSSHYTNISLRRFVLRRTVADLTDYLIAWTVASLVVGAAFLINGTEGMKAADITSSTLVLFATVLLFNEVIFARRTGASLGKKALGFRTVKQGTVDRPGADSLFMRTVIKYGLVFLLLEFVPHAGIQSAGSTLYIASPFIILGSFMKFRDGTGLHDRIAKTKTVTA